MIYCVINDLNSKKKYPIGMISTELIIALIVLFLRIDFSAPLSAKIFILQYDNIIVIVSLRSKNDINIM